MIIDKRKIIKADMTKDRCVLIPKRRISTGENHIQIPSEESIKNRVYRCLGEKIIVLCNDKETRNNNGEICYIVPFTFLQEFHRKAP